MSAWTDADKIQIVVQEWVKSEEGDFLTTWVK